MRCMEEERKSAACLDRHWQWDFRRLFYGSHAFPLLAYVLRLSPDLGYFSFGAKLKSRGLTDAVGKDNDRLFIPSLR